MNVNATQGIDGLRKALPELAAQGPRPGRGIRGGCTLARDFVAKLKVAGVYRVLVAREQGGLGGSLRVWLEMA